VRSLAVLPRPRQGLVATAPWPSARKARFLDWDQPGSVRHVAAPVGLAMILNRSRQFETASRRNLHEERKSGRTAINRLG